MMPNQCPSKLTLEAFFYDAASSKNHPQADHFNHCPRCLEKLASLKQNHESFLTNYPFHKLMQSIELRKEEKASQSFWKKIWANNPLKVALVLTSISSIMFFTLWNQNASAPLFSTKGKPSLHFYFSDHGKINPGKDGMSLEPNSDIQFIYSTEKDEYLLLLGVEENGNITVYYPQNGENFSIEAGQKKKLPQAIRWQPNSNGERFYAFFSENEISLEETTQAIQKELSQGKSIEDLSKLPLSYSQSSVLIHVKK